MSLSLRAGCIPIAIKSKSTATVALYAPDIQLYLPSSHLLQKYTMYETTLI